MTFLQVWGEWIGESGKPAWIFGLAVMVVSPFMLQVIQGSKGCTCLEETGFLGPGTENGTWMMFDMELSGYGRDSRTSRTLG